VAAVRARLHQPGEPAVRSVGRRAGADAPRGNTLEIEAPIHLGYTLAHAPQVFVPDAGYAVNVGVEDLYVTGGQNNQLWMITCDQCWVSNVDSDGTVANLSGDGTAGVGLGMVGAHLQIDASYRVAVRDSYFHHATHVVQGGGAYGVSLSEHTSESLVDVIANALGVEGPVGTFALNQVYELHDSSNAGSPTVWHLGFSPIDQGGNGYHNAYAYDPYPWQPGTTGATLLRKGNYDFVTHSVADGAATGAPALLYLAGPPPWWGANPWPYVEPSRNPVVGTLPAKARFDALGVPVQ
jgi:hypothetical protein